MTHGVLSYLGAAGTILVRRSFFMEFNLSAGAFAAEQKFMPLDGKTVYDVMILGGGPAGLTAAVYCMRKGVSTAMIVKRVGGQVAETSGIENYMGYRYINGMELAEKFREQVLQFGIAYEEGPGVRSVEQGAVKKIALDDGRTFSARTIIVATGKSWRKLDVPGEDEFLGKGVAYCATCDAPFFAGKDVIVAGGGNSGVEAAIDLAKIARKVILVQFLDNLTADRVLVDGLGRFGNVEILLGHEIKAITGDSAVRAVSAADRKTGVRREIAADGIFIEIGLVPNTSPFRGVVDLNDAGEIVIDCACKTSAPGIFAAGDVTSVPFKQIIIAGGEGAKAALSACEYLLRDAAR